MERLDGKISTDSSGLLGETEVQFISSSRGSDAGSSGGEGVRYSMRYEVRVCRPAVIQGAILIGPLQKYLRVRSDSTPADT
jgi:hypothetical protein